VRELQDLARSASPVSYATGDEPPFLIVHGTEDMTVPYPQSQLMYQALGSGDATFHTVIGAGHGGPAFEHPAVVDHVEAFLDQYLGPVPLPPPADAAPRAVPPAPGLVTINARAWVNPDATPSLATFETAIVNEWIPHIDATYRTISARDGRAIEGQSMGGFGAAHLGFTLRRALPAEARPGTKPIRTVTAHTC